MAWLKRKNQRIEVSDSDVHRLFIFRGDVQGVGFRWKASGTANQLNLAGWVRNCYDGSVEMDVQGPQEKIDKLLTELYRDRYIQITDLESHSLKLDEDPRPFEVKY